MICATRLLYLSIYSLFPKLNRCTPVCALHSSTARSPQRENEPLSHLSYQSLVSTLAAAPYPENITDRLPALLILFSLSLFHSFILLSTTLGHSVDGARWPTAPVGLLRPFYLLCSLGSKILNAWFASRSLILCILNTRCVLHIRS